MSQTRTKSLSRALSLALTLTLILGIMLGFAPAAVAAGPGDVAPAEASTTGDSYGYISPSGGKFLAPINPTVAGSIPVSTREQLEAIKNNMSGKYHLTNDIDLSDADWIPIGEYPIPFTGIFDGQGHVIRNLTITKSYSDVGLFGYAALSASIKNIGLEDTHIDIVDFSTNYRPIAGGICGVAYPSYTGAGATIISNCYNTGTVSVTTSAASDVGGICGSANAGFGTGTVTIRDCYNTASVSAHSKYSNAGGISAHAVRRFTISNCYNTGAVSVSNPPNSTIQATFTAGGICGFVSPYLDTSTVSDCYNIGTISSSLTSSISGSLAGGICGHAGVSNTTRGDIVISKSYNTGDVFADAPVNSQAGAGGICAYTNTGVGTVTINNSYWSIDSAQIVNGIAYTIENKKGVGSGTDITTPLTTAQMKQQASFVGFDFNAVWGFKDGVNNGYPILMAIDPESATYTVTFQDYDGTVLKTATVLHGQAATAPPSPLREGYVFTNWDKPFGHVTGDLTITAQYCDLEDINNNGIPVNISIDPNTHGDFQSNADKINVVTSGIEALPGQELSLRFSKAENDMDIDGTKYKKNNAVQMEIDLVGAESSQLSGPVVITVPIPSGVAPADFWILHYHQDGTYDKITPILNGDGTCTFAVTSFSVFAFVNGAGFTLTGTVRSYDPNTSATVRLIQDGKVIQTTLTETSLGSGPAEQVFTFTGVAPGEYTLIITKPGHASYTVQTVTVGDADVNLTPTTRDAAGAITLPCGDITGDDMINDGDLAVLWLAANYNKSAADPSANELCDLNGDGMINDGDLAILWLAANYNKGAVVAG